MEALVTRLENKLRAGWRSMVRGVKDENTIPALERKIASNNIAELVEGIDDAIATFTADLAAGFVHAGQFAARRIDETIDGTFRFDMMDPAVVEWAQTSAKEIASSLIEEQQAVARRVVQLGTSRGDDYLTIAEDVQRSVGLTVGQVDQVERYRQVLEAGDYSRALSYELADGRYDAVLERADEAGTYLGETRIEAMVDRYRDNWVTARQDTVALTEAQNTSHAGVQESFEQAVERGVFDASELTRVWHTRHDAKVRASHRVMDNQTRGIDEPFHSGDGNELMYPGDENAPASDTANCRCVTVITFPGGVQVEEVKRWTFRKEWTTDE